MRIIDKIIIALLVGWIIWMVASPARADVDFDLNRATSFDIGLGSWHSNDGWWRKKFYPTTYVSPTTGRIHDGYKLVRTDHKWNEINPSLGFRQGINDILEIGGGIILQNSYGLPGGYVGLEVHTDRNKPVSIGLAAGITDSYKGTISEQHMPINGYGYVVPTLQFTKKLKRSAHALKANLIGIGGEEYAAWFQYSYGY